MEKSMEYGEHMDKLQKLYSELKNERDEYVKGNITLEEFLTATNEKNAEISKVVDELRNAINKLAQEKL